MPDSTIHLILQQPFEPVPPVAFDALANGDEQVFNTIVREYAPRLMSTALYITRNYHIAEDIVQEAFLQLWKQRAEIVYANPAGWLYRIVYNQANKHLKRESSRARLYASLIQLQPGSHKGAEERLILREDMAAYNKAFSLLPKMQQQVYRMRREEGLSRREIAQILNISPNTVKVHLLRAVQFIREHLHTAWLLIVFFLFNNIFFRAGNTKSDFRELYNVQRSKEKKLPEKTIVYETSDNHPYCIADLFCKQNPCTKGFH